MCRIKFLKAKVITSIKIINQGNDHQRLLNSLGNKLKENMGEGKPVLKDIPYVI